MRNQQAFSLVEVMLVMGLMGMAALVFISMQKMQARGQATAATQFEIFNLVQDIQLTLLNSKACMETLNGITLNKDEPTPINVIKNSQGAERFQVGVSTQGSKVTLNSLDLKATDLVFDEIGAGLVDLNIVIDKNSAQAQGTKTVRHRVPLFIAIDEENNVVDCFSTYEAAVLKAKEEMCKDLGGIYSDKKCQSIAPKLNDQETVCNGEKEGLMRYSALTKSVFLCNGSKWMESINFQEFGVTENGDL